MNYPAPDGHQIQSSPSGPVTYACASPDNWADGTYESLETASTPDNNLQQIKVVRQVSQGQVTITVTERTQLEISDYFQNLP